MSVTTGCDRSVHLLLRPLDGIAYAILVHGLGPSPFAGLERSEHPELVARCDRRIADDVVARCLLSETIRIFKRNRPNDDIAAELAAAAVNLDDDSPLIFMRP